METSFRSSSSLTLYRLDACLTLIANGSADTSPSSRFEIGLTSREKSQGMQCAAHKIRSTAITDPIALADRI